jgi:Nucleotidyl transferase AbiEii toxin, Type IV TA system
MHDAILDPRQVKLLPVLKAFSNTFGLVGGTAIALQLGHRRSVDFDLITYSNLQGNQIRNSIKKSHFIESTIVDEADELTLVVDGVKLTFLHYPYHIEFEESLHDIIRMPNLPSLASMKAFALGRRAKWKDYVDLYYIIQKYSFKEIIQKAHDVFGPEFNEKLFREQLAYFSDIDYSESIDVMEGFALDKEYIQKKLEEISLQK